LGPNVIKLLGACIGSQLSQVNGVKRLNASWDRSCEFIMLVGNFQTASLMLEIDTFKIVSKISIFISSSSTTVSNADYDAEVEQWLVRRERHPRIPDKCIRAGVNFINNLRAAFCTKVFSYAFQYRGTSLFADSVFAVSLIRDCLFAPKPHYSRFLKHLTSLICDFSSKMLGKS